MPRCTTVHDVATQCNMIQQSVHGIRCRREGRAPTSFRSLRPKSDHSKSTGTRAVRHCAGEPSHAQYRPRAHTLRGRYRSALRAQPRLLIAILGLLVVIGARPMVARQVSTRISACACPALPCPARPCPALPCPALPCPACLPSEQSVFPIDWLTASGCRYASVRASGGGLACACLHMIGFVRVRACIRTCIMRTQTHALHKTHAHPHAHTHVPSSIHTRANKHTGDYLGHDQRPAQARCRLCQAV
jgi:hypothetical protein